MAYEPGRWRPTWALACNRPRPLLGHFGKWLHNNVNPLVIEEKGMFLVVGQEHEQAMKDKNFFRLADKDHKDKEGGIVAAMLRLEHLPTGS